MKMEIKRQELKQKIATANKKKTENRRNTHTHRHTYPLWIRSIKKKNKEYNKRQQNWNYENNHNDVHVEKAIENL